MRRCTNLRSLTIRLESGHGCFEHDAQTIWDALSKTLYTLPHSPRSDVCTSSKLDSVTLETAAAFKGPLANIEIYYGASGLLKDALQAVEQNLLDITSQGEPKWSAGGTCIRFSHQRHEEPVGGYERVIRTLFPRLHEQGALEFGMLMEGSHC